MFNYIIAFQFILFGETDDLFKFWKAEIIRRDRFIFHRLLREKKQRSRNFLFWWRLANEMYLNGNGLQKKVAKRINEKLLSDYGCNLELGLRIGKKINILHHIGIVITNTTVIGEYLTIRQGTTIGDPHSGNENEGLHIGNNVDIGAHTFISGSASHIGDNVKIGAMSFVNKNIPSNRTYITKKESRIINNE